MLSSAKRRISILERSIQLPMTAERFAALVEERMRLTGMSVGEASQSLIDALSPENLGRLEKELLELMQRAFGDDVEAMDEAMRNASMTAAVAD
jgi:hypothetical protein